MPFSVPSYPNAQDLLNALRFLPEEGQIWLGEQRMLLMPLASSSFFRNELINTLGMERARRLFMQLGYYSGRMDAELGMSLRSHGENLEESYLAGPQLHALQGHVQAVPGTLEIDLDNDHFYSEFTWKGSFEVDVRRSQGLQEEPVCWTLLGYACAYASHLLGCEVQFREVSCRACGDAECRIVGKLAAEWPDHKAFSELFREAPLIDEFYKLQEYVAKLEGSLSYARGQEDWGPIGSAPAFCDMLNMLDSAAATDISVLLLGETGTGKEILARRLHDKSQRAQGPFIAVNCAAIPPELIESELFGVEKGAYTGAVKTRIGRFERANGGTLFLDELAELPLRAQAALLRSLQEHQIERVGGETIKDVDVRIIAATNADLLERVEQGGFRKDLFYRLNAFTLSVPPLSERREDIMTLVTHFLSHFEHYYQRRTLGLSDQARSAMTQYCWPGNIRELKNSVERGLILTADHKHITEEALFGSYRVPTIEREKARWLNASGIVEPIQAEAKSATPQQLISPLLEAGMTMEDVEVELIEAAHSHNDGNVTAAARQLGMTRAAYAYRLNKYKLY